MNTDIRVTTTIFTNKKIKRLIRRKGYEGFYNLISLWINTAIHRSTGSLDGYDSDDLMDILNTNDEKMVELLVDLNLLDFDGKTYAIHNWKKHNPWAFDADKRSEIARKAAKTRWESHNKSKVVNMKEEQ